MTMTMLTRMCGDQWQCCYKYWPADTMDPDKNILNNGGDQVRAADTCSLLINISYFVLSGKIGRTFLIFSEKMTLPLYIWTPPNLLSKPSSLNSDLNKYSECPDGWSEEGEGGCWFCSSTYSKCLVGKIESSSQHQKAIFESDIFLKMKFIWDDVRITTVTSNWARFY